MRVVEPANEAQRSAARSLVEEYAGSLPIDLGFQGFREELAQFPRGYQPPDGAVLLAYERGVPAGVVAVRRFRGATCEMKRLYVRPRFRGRGIGRALAVRVVARAVELGYRAMRLDTLPTMGPAIELYRQLGFRDIPPYRFNPVAGAVYLERRLDGPPPRRGRAKPGRHDAKGRRRRTRAATSGGSAGRPPAART